MASAVDSVAVLTYHSISNESGPTSISPELFAAQMTTLAESGADVVKLEQVEHWLRGGREFTRRTIAITFDDAFRDFYENAHPVLEKYGFHSTVFVPTAVVGGEENWIGANESARPLMSWAQIRLLAASGVSFGSHAQQHVDLTKLNETDLEFALANSRRDLETALGVSATHFAPPYGRSNANVCKAIAQYYNLSVGVSLGEVTRNASIHDLPRIEMYYFRDLHRWREFLAGRGGAYLKTRQMAREIRRIAVSALRAGTS